MGAVVCKCGIKRESGWLYYVDKKGNAARVNMKRAGKPYKKKVQVLHKCGVKRKPGFLYYVDKKGNVACAKMARGGRKKKRK
jgi:phage pi2 protein 07